MIQTSDSSRIYFGNNSDVIPYPVPFKFHDDEDLVIVTVDPDGDEHPQLLGTDYTVTGAGDPNGGSVTFTWPVPTVDRVSIVRVVPMTQLTSYEEGDSFPAKSHEKALDKLTMEVQQLARGMGTGEGDADDLGTAFRLTEASGGINAVSKIPDSMLGLDAMGSAILRTANDMLAWMGQVGTVWADTPARLGTRGAYAGQLGVQLDNSTIYLAHSTTPGDWFPFLLGTGIIAATDGVPHLMTPPAGDLVGTDQSQVLYNKTLESPTIHTPTGLTKSDVGLSQVDNTSDLNKPLSSATGAALAFKQDKNEKAIANGYASLDGGGKVPLTQIPDSVIGASQYQGTWNAATNTPTIPAAVVGNKGWYYSVSVAGTTNINGINSWAVGDQIISNGTVWQKIVNVSAVSSVNSKTGAVVLVPADLNLGNVDNTSDAAKNSASVMLTNKTINGASNTLVVRLDADVTNNLPVTRLNNGTGAGPNTWWCGDQSWKQPPGTGDVGGPAGSADGEAALFSGTTGKLIRRFSGAAGFPKFSATGFVTTQPKMMAPDLDPNVISGQPVKTFPDTNDTILLCDSVSGQLRSMLASNAASRSLPPQYLAGLVVTNNVADAANDLDITAGGCRDTTDTYNIYVSAMTKRLDAPWAAGTNQGGRDTGVIADAWWHVFAIWNPTTGVGDVLLSQSLASPTLPTGFTVKRRIGSVLRDSSYGGIRQFSQVGDYYEWTTGAREISGLGIAPPYATLHAMSVPPGMAIQGLFAISCSNNTTSCVIYFQNPVHSGLFAGCVAIAAANSAVTDDIMIVTNASSQIMLSYPSGSGLVTVYIATTGYWDHRGKQGIIY